MSPKMDELRQEAKKSCNWQKTNEAKVKANDDFDE